MSKIGRLEMIDDVAIFRAFGEVPLSGAAHLVATAVATARASNHSKLMVVASSLTGFSSPSLEARREIAREWAKAAGGDVRLALVLRPEWIDPHKFGVVAAANFGLELDVFTSEEAALAWFRGRED